MTLMEGFKNWTSARSSWLAGDGGWGGEVDATQLLEEYRIDIVVLD